ncbi:MAG: recombinase family protein [Candidatus Cryptobacteroides sp.]
MVYAYIRVSTEMQTYANQEFEIINYCNSHKIKIDKWYSESVSGTIPVDKRLLGKVIRKMNRGDLLICTEISRLGRNMLMIMSILNLCAGNGIRIQTIKDNFILSDNINSKIIAFAFALAAEIERNLISQRTREALAVKKLEGTKLGRPVGSSKKKKLFLESSEQIGKMLEKGIPMKTVAKKYGLHCNTLRRYLRSENLLQNNEITNL